ncbi:MAG: hypothetical protein PHG28_07360 [Rhodoferax sp.]|nr:hypothetical protein [Rhodoferax sp.]MDD3936123.1 hypothetical protein [Rhodoferax sp.]
MHALGSRNLDQDRFPPRLELLRPTLEHVIHRQQALLHSLIESIGGGFQLCKLLLENPQGVVLTGTDIFEVAFHLLQHLFQAFSGQHLFGKRSQNHVVHFGHGHRWRAAGTSTATNA